MTAVPSQLLLPRAPGATVAVFRALRLGDMLCATPAFRALRAALPEARILLVGLPWAEQFAARFPRYIDEFIPFPGHPAFPEQAVRQHELADFYANMRARRCDLALQLHGSGEVSNFVVRAFGARHMAGFGEGNNRPVAGEHLVPLPASGTEPERVLHLLKTLGAPACGAGLEFPITAEDERELGASGVAAGLSAGGYVCIHPGASVRNKCWPAARFAQVADGIAGATGLRIVLTGSAAEAELTRAVAHAMRTPAIDSTGPLSIGAMAALMRNARLLVCNDTGVSHIAAALGLNSIVIFSTADMQRWAPADRTRHRCLWDPGGERVSEVIAHALSLLGLAVPASHAVSVQKPHPDTAAQRRTK